MFILSFVLAWDLSDIEDIECLGITEGIIGKVEHSNIFEPRLIIIKESVPVGNIYFHHTIYKIKSICILNMGTTNQELDLCVCTKHGSSNSVGNVNKSLNKKMGGRLFENSAFLNKTVGAVKNVSNTIKTTTQQAATQVILKVQKLCKSQVKHHQFHYSNIPIYLDYIVNFKYHYIIFLT